MVELITIDKDALIRAIYSSTDASEVDARTIVDSVTAPPPAGAQQAVANRKAWKITVPSGLSHWFTEDDDVVAHFSLPDQGHKIEEYHRAPVAAQGERYSFVCNAGCGVCGVKVAPFEYERTETLEGEHLGSKYRPHIVSSCCGSEVHVYDNDADDWGAAVTLAATPAPEAAPSAKEGEAVAVVESFTNGSYSRNYKLRWLKDVPEGTRLFASPPIAPELVVAAKHVAFSNGFDAAFPQKMETLRALLKDLTPAGGDR